MSNFSIDKTAIKIRGKFLYLSKMHFKAKQPVLPLVLESVPFFNAIIFSNYWNIAQILAFRLMDRFWHTNKTYKSFRMCCSAFILIGTIAMLFMSNTKASTEEIRSNVTTSNTSSADYFLIILCKNRVLYQRLYYLQRMCRQKDYGPKYAKKLRVNIHEQCYGTKTCEDRRISNCCCMPYALLNEDEKERLPFAWAYDFLKVFRKCIDRTTCEEVEQGFCVDDENIVTPKYKIKSKYF